MAVTNRGSEVVNWVLKFNGGPNVPDGERRGWPNCPLYYRRTVGNEVHEWRQSAVNAVARECVMDYFGVVRSEA